MSSLLALLSLLQERTTTSSFLKIQDDGSLRIVSERAMSPYHKEKIAFAHRGNKQSASTKKKISKSMAGKSNFKGKKHTAHAKDVIGAKRGSDDRIRGRRWIVNSSNKTYRRYHAPGGYKIGRRKFSESMTFKDFINL